MDHTPAGAVNVFRGADKAIEALAFSPDHSALLVAGIRLFELLAEER